MNIYLTLFVLWTCHFFVDFMIGLFSVYKTLSGLELAKAGTIACIAAFSGEVLQVVFGSLSDRGYRRVLVLAGTLLACSAALFVYSQNYLVLFGLLFLLFIGSGAFHPAAAGLVGSLSRDRKGLFISIFACGGALGLALSQTIFFSMHHRFGPEYIGLIALPILAFLLICLMLPLVGTQRVSTTARPSMWAVFGLFRNMELRYLYVAQVCNQTLFWATQFLLPDILKLRGCEEWVTFGGGHFALIIGGACAMVPAGLLADRFSPKMVLRISLIGGLCAFFPFLWLPVSHSALVMVGLFCLGAFLGVVTPLSITLANQLIPHSPGMVSAYIMGLAWCVSESLGPASGLLTGLFPGPDAPILALLSVGCINFIGLWAVSQMAREAPEAMEVQAMG